MMRPRFQVSITAISILLFFGVEEGLSQEKLSRPNVIIILTDDQGYGDISAHGNTYIDTPNMDILHSESVRFTDFHVDPTCAPTRAALLTGKYAHHAGVWHTISGGNHLRNTETTMASIFKEAGYRTALFGKWHLGANYPYRPIDRGFQEWLGNGDGGTGTTDDWFYNDRVNDVYWYNGERKAIPGYAPDVFFNKAIENIKEANETPFFIYLATYLPHGPHTVPDEEMTEGYDSKVSKYTSYFFAGINQVDKNIGKLRQVLEESGKAENTILIFMSDNGGTAGVSLYNAGMRGNKGTPYEGGHRVPFFVHWPKGNLAHGKDVRQLTAHIDVLPTLLDLCGITPKKQIVVDGISLANQLKRPNMPIKKRTLFVEVQRTFKPQKWHGTSGMMGPWRLVNNKELYHIEKDPGQERNLITDNPEIAKKINQEFERYWKLVMPNDREEPKVIIGHPADKEVLLTSSDWYLPEVPWNHAQVGHGKRGVGEWKVNVHQAGTYRFEVRRWPKEANTSITDVPTFNKAIDAWTVDGGVDKLLYKATLQKLPISVINLKVGEHTQSKAVQKNDTNVAFTMNLPAGETTVNGEMLDNSGNTIAGSYYVYIVKI